MKIRGGIQSSGSSTSLLISMKISIVAARRSRIIHALRGIGKFKMCQIRTANKIIGGEVRPSNRGFSSSRAWVMIQLQAQHIHSLNDEMHGTKHVPSSVAPALLLAHVRKQKIDNDTWSFVFLVGKVIRVEAVVVQTGVQVRQVVIVVQRCFIPAIEYTNWFETIQLHSVSVCVSLS